MFFSKNWIPKLKVETSNNFFRQQIERIVDDNTMCFEILDESEEFSSKDYGMCVIISDKLISKSNLNKIYHGICIYENRSEIIEDGEIKNQDKVTYYDRNTLRESELVEKLKRISLTLSSTIKEKGILNTFSKDLEETKLIIEDYGQSLEEASILQTDIMTRFPKNMDFDIYATYKPYRLISGDVIFVEELQDYLFIMVADVTDHGFLSGLYGATLYTLAKNYVHTANLMSIDLKMWVAYMYKAARLFYPIKTKVKAHDLLTSTATFAIINKRTNDIEVCFCGSAAELPIIIDNTNNVKFFQINEVDDICGTLGGEFCPKIKTIKKKFYLGSSILFYTDGVTEIFLDYADTEEKDVKKIYSKEGILKTVKDTCNKGNDSPKEIVNAILNDANAYAISSDITKNEDIPITDDLSILCIKRIDRYVM